MKRIFTLSAVLCASLAAACGGPLAQRPALEETVAAAAPTPLPPQPEVAYPAVPLDGELLYDLLLAEIAAKRGYPDVAVESLARAAAQTRDPRLAARATLFALYAKDYVRTMETAALWADLAPAQIEPREALAEALFQLDRVDQAKEQLAKILELAQPANVGQAYLKIAAGLGRQQNRAAALEVMRSLVQARAEMREPHFALAHLAVRTGRLDEALAAINRALEISPGWEEAAIFKARVLVSQKDQQQALDYFQDFLDAYPQATSFRLNYARYLIDLKHWDQARAQFKRVVAETPQDAEALYAAGLLALQANHADEAQRYLELTLKLQPENDQARLYLGQLAEQRQDYAQAARWYSGIDSDQYRFDAQVRIGMMLATQGDVDAARNHLREMLPQTQQQRVQLILSEEQILRDAKRFDDSLQVLNAAIETMPDENDLLYARALVAERLDLLDLHESDLRKVIAADPNNAHALNALGYTLADRTDRHQEAIELIERALTLKPDDPYIIDSMGWVHYRMGNHDEALKLLRRALTIRPDAEISAHLGEVLWVTGDRTGAENVWQDALKNTPNNELLLNIIKKFKH